MDMVLLEELPTTASRMDDRTTEAPHVTAAITAHMPITASAIGLLVFSALSLSPQF
jgi:hypothetical protein